MIFDFSEWVINALINGVKNGDFPKSWASVQIANYRIKGAITDDDIIRFDQEAVYIPVVEDENMLEQEQV